MFGRATIRLGIGPHSSLPSVEIIAKQCKVLTIRLLVVGYIYVINAIVISSRS